jgi:hypothetical protein
MSSITVPKDVYEDTYNGRVAQLIDSGLDLRAAREQAAMEMMHWHIVDNRIVFDDELDQKESGIYG